MTCTGAESLAVSSKLNSDLSGTAGKGMSEGRRAIVVCAMPYVARCSMRGIMCVLRTEWIWRVRVVLSWLRIVWLREEEEEGEDCSEYGGGRCKSFSAEYIVGGVGESLVCLAVMVMTSVEDSVKVLFRNEICF